MPLIDLAALLAARARPRPDLGFESPVFTQLGRVVQGRASPELLMSAPQGSLVTGSPAALALGVGPVRAVAPVARTLLNLRQQPPAEQALSLEELARKERFFKLDRAGAFSDLGRRPDPATLRSGEAVLAFKPTGEVRVVNSTGLGKDADVLQKFAQQIARLRLSLRPQED